MINNEQLIEAIRNIYPQIKEQDHGRIYWVGRPMNGDTQTADAFIVKWGYGDEMPMPDKAQIAEALK